MYESRIESNLEPTLDFERNEIWNSRPTKYVQLTIYLHSTYYLILKQYLELNIGTYVVLISIGKMFAYATTFPQHLTIKCLSNPIHPHYNCEHEH
ncbi:hypothetical protein Erwinia_phage_Mauresque_00053 [Erwinia phage Mauresque]|nr:hypothetical protein Erwinia_phage_Berlingot_00052 [Erwinia phage Berlingot]WJN64095.1 hypothetical protein Erwinia_phage_Mauresque_00053 [Erwinia phage Mauresque]